ncbi:MAG: hypothetical protein KAI24_17575 [Planctomycetes bacterium]|nr:hypothetical protein [Planctomycetota bacterium]
MRTLALSLLCFSALPLGGCCSIARAWCGPDRSPWVSVDFSTPERAVRTLLEALRRDQPEVVYDALSDDLRDRMGFDGMTLELAWPQVKERYPYLHVAGYADVPAATVRDNEAVVQVDVEGNRLAIGLVRQCYWELRYQRPGENVPDNARAARSGRRLDSLMGVVEVQLDEESEFDRSLVALLPQAVLHQNVDEIPISNIDFLGVHRIWKVTSLTLLD